jgi:hypothetical protein
VPRQAPAIADELHPGQLHAPWSDKHCAHVVIVGVPMHVGAAWKRCGAGGMISARFGQQSWPEHWLLSVQVLGQLAAQSPWQQMGVDDVERQSADVVHALGQAVIDGLTHTPETPSAGSSLGAEVQQTSPFAVLQSVSAEHWVGQSLAAVQMGVL